MAFDCLINFYALTFFVVVMEGFLFGIWWVLCFHVFCWFDGGFFIWGLMGGGLPWRIFVDLMVFVSLVLCVDLVFFLCLMGFNALIFFVDLMEVSFGIWWGFDVFCWFVGEGGLFDVFVDWCFVWFDVGYERLPGHYDQPLSDFWLWEISKVIPPSAKVSEICKFSDPPYKMQSCYGRSRSSRTWSKLLLWQRTRKCLTPL